MYLYETGTENSLSALHETEDDKEFAVKLLVKMAIAWIEHGEEAKETVWRKMTEHR